MRHWNPEAHIGDDKYILASVLPAVASATAGNIDEQEMQRVERSSWPTRRTDDDGDKASQCSGWARKNTSFRAAPDGRYYCRFIIG
eukprot:jgi/Tetstr1/446863/TSEL_034341.t1